MYEDKINELIKTHTDEFLSDCVLKTTCKYVLDNGKRIRSSIVLDVCNSISNTDINICCLCIEYIHTSSLIIDDLECMDNANKRRNKDCIHVKYGQATAQLTSVMLLSLFMDSLFKGVKNLKLDENKKDYITKYFLNNFSESIKNTTKGQLFDLYLTDKISNELKSDLEKISIDPYEIIVKKTGPFFESSFLLGWLCGDGNFDLIEDVKSVSLLFSIIYQIMDDIDDVEEDINNNIKYNYVIYYGMDKTLSDMSKYVFELENKLKVLELYSSYFQGLISIFKNKINEKR